MATTLYRPSTTSSGNLSVTGDLAITGDTTFTGGDVTMVTSATQFFGADNAATSPQFSFSNDQDTGYHRPTTNSVGAMCGGSEGFRVNASLNMGVGGVTTPLGKCHIDQKSTSGAIPVLYLDQADVSEEFFRMVGESTTDATQSLVDAANLTTPGSIVGWYKIYVEDVQSSGPITDGIYYVPFYSAPSA